MVAFWVDRVRLSVGGKKRLGQPVLILSWCPSREMTVKVSAAKKSNNKK